MFEQLFLYFYNLFVWDTPELDFLGDIEFTIGGQIINLPTYLSVSFALISLIIIVVLCCLFIKKMVSSVVNLMSR